MRTGKFCRAGSNVPAEWRRAHPLPLRFLMAYQFTRERLRLVP